MREINKKDIMEIIKNSGVSGDVSKIEYDTSLREAGMDSLDMFNILLALEEKFGVKIADEEIGKLNSVNSIVELLNRK